MVPVLGVSAQGDPLAPLTKAERQAVVSAAEVFLDLLDSGDTKGAWRLLDRQMKREMPSPKALRDYMAKVQENTGVPLERELHCAEPGPADSDDPRLRVVSLHYVSSYPMTWEHPEEALIMVLEDGQWRVGGQAFSPR